MNSWWTCTRLFYKTPVQCASKVLSNFFVLICVLKLHNINFIWLYTIKKSKVTSKKKMQLKKTKWFYCCYRIFSLTVNYKNHQVLRNSFHFISLFIELPSLPIILVKRRTFWISSNTDGVIVNIHFALAMSLHKWIVKS